MKRFIFVVCITLVAIVVIGFVLLPNLGRARRAEFILSSVLKTNTSVQAIEMFGASEGVLFGDSAYAWRLNVSKLGTNWLGEFRNSDDADLAAAAESMEHILGLELDLASKRAVLRRRIGGWSVYVIVGDHAHCVHLLVQTH